MLCDLSGITSTHVRTGKTHWGLVNGSQRSKERKVKHHLWMAPELGYPGQGPGCGPEKPV